MENESDCAPDAADNADDAEDQRGRRGRRGRCGRGGRGGRCGRGGRVEQKKTASDDGRDRILYRQLVTRNTLERKWMQDIRVTAVQKPSQTTAPVFVVVTPQNRPDKIGRSERVGLRIYDEHSGAQHPTTETAAKPPLDARTKKSTLLVRNVSSNCATDAYTLASMRTSIKSAISPARCGQKSMMLGPRAHQESQGGRDRTQFPNCTNDQARRYSAPWVKNRVADR